MNRRALAAVLLGAAAALYAVRLGSPFAHYHENVTACYASWGRNAVRFGPAASGFAPIRAVGIRPGPGVPTPHQLYSHRPPTVTFLVSLSCRLFGPTEGALRLVGLLATLAAVAAFLAVARRLLGPDAGLAAAALFAFTPGVAFYGVAVAHQTFGLLGGLLIVLAYLRWRERPDRARLAQLGAAVLAGAWLDWPATYAAGGVGLAHLLTSRERRWVGVAVPATAVAAFGLFVLYLYALDPRGLVPLKDFASTGSAHSGGAPLGAYVVRQAREAATSFTLPLLALAALGAARLRPRSQPGDAVLLSTALLGADLVLFRSLSHGHPFMIVPFAPFLALAGARGLQVLAGAGRGWRAAGAVAVLAFAGHAGLGLWRAHAGGTFPYYVATSRALGEAIRAATAPDERSLVRLYADEHVLGYYADRPAALYTPSTRTLARLEDVVQERDVDEAELLRRLGTPGHGYAWFVTAGWASAAERIPEVGALRAQVADPAGFVRDRYGFEDAAAPSALVAWLRARGVPEQSRDGFLFYDLRALR